MGYYCLYTSQFSWCRFYVLILHPLALHLAMDNKYIRLSFKFLGLLHGLVDAYNWHGFCVKISLKP